MFLFLTKFPSRLSKIHWPENVWLGATVDTQARVVETEEAFAQLPDGILKFANCCPLLGPVHFNRPELFSWFLVGGVAYLPDFPFIPPREWIDGLTEQARSVGAAVFHEFTTLSMNEIRNPTRDLEELLIREMPEPG
jgi:protein gp37